MTVRWVDAGCPVLAPATPVAAVPDTRTADAASVAAAPTEMRLRLFMVVLPSMHRTTRGRSDAATPRHPWPRPIGLRRPVRGRSSGCTSRTAGGGAGPAGGRLAGAWGGGRGGGPVRRPATPGGSGATIGGARGLG